MAWDRMRREVTYRINLAAAHYRAEKLNEILPRLQDVFESHVGRGVILTLESGELQDAREWLAELDEQLA